MPTPLLATKFYIPTPPHGNIPRAALLARLDAGLAGARRLTLVCAPPGFGKTTLVAQWLFQQRENNSTRAFAWLSLDQADSDPARFLIYLIAALQTVRPDAGLGALEMLGAPQPIPTEIILTALLNDLAADLQPLLLVMDDYHLIQSQSVHSALTFLLDNLPPHVHLAITSRADPPIPLARWRARGQLSELRQRDLRFSASETAAFIQHGMGLGITGDNLSALQERTEGWIAGLQLAALALQAQSHGEADKDGTGATSFIQDFSGSDRYILDYLVSEVLSQQTPELQEFMLTTAPLERLCGPLCDALTGDNFGQAYLEKLESDNLFLISLDNERRWFRYHRLFHDLLKHRMRLAKSERLPALHRRAADWHRTNGYPSEAIDHAIQSGDAGLAVQIIRENAMPALANGQTFILNGWLESLPSGLLDAHPWLVVFRAWVWLLTGQFDQLGSALQKIATSGEMPLVDNDKQIDDLTIDDLTIDDLTIGAHFAAIQAYIATQSGNIPLARELAARALQSLPPEERIVRSFVNFTLGGAGLMSDDIQSAVDAYRQAYQLAASGHNPHVATPAQRILAQLIEDQGRLRQAADLNRQAIQMATSKQKRSSPYAAGAYGRLGAIQFEWNDLRAARQSLQMAAELAEKWGNPDALAGSAVRLGYLRAVLGDPKGAEEALAKAGRLLNERQLTPGSDHYIRYLQVRIWLQHDQLARAVQWAEASSMPPGDRVVYINVYAFQALACVWLAQGQYQQAREVLEHLHAWAVNSGMDGKRVKILILQALALDGIGDTGQAITKLSQALSLAEPEGYMRSFLEEGRPAERLIKMASDQGIMPEYSGKLLHAFTESGLGDMQMPGIPASVTQPGLIETVSQREIEVLTLIAEGRTNQEIADQLVISLGTVKAHTSNIYRKLDVRNRTEAINRARRVGLL